MLGRSANCSPFGAPLAGGLFSLHAGLFTISTILKCWASPPFAHGSSYVDVLKGLTHQPIPKPPCTTAIAHRQEHVEHFVDSAMAYPWMVQPLVHDVCSPTVNASASPLADSVLPPQSELLIGSVPLLSVYVPKPCGAPPPATQAHSRIHLADPPSTKVPSQDCPESSPLGLLIMAHPLFLLPTRWIKENLFLFPTHLKPSMKFPFSNPRVLIHAARKSY
ncbi:hypothetical protein Salat_2725900 [Sesamum alatum]|uniref:Uncharacterized protein n=1 Tax=Sesamum alatum TaxID=300844 RepID=A0AAE2C8M5_9LAMI|nr:hypothetical protein Salat_2725900 [Sesamum alatum]